MTIVNINTREIIEELGDCIGIYWTTSEYWSAYKLWCREMEKKELNYWYGKKI